MCADLDGQSFLSRANFYWAYKNAVLVNPEHTCWIDPVTLDQLCRRFGLATTEVHWVKEKWELSQVILNDTGRRYDMFTGRWIFEKAPGITERFVAPCLDLAFRTLFPREYTRTVYQRHGASTRRLLFLRLVGSLFGAYWAFRRAFIPIAPINRHELFVSVLRRVGARGDGE